MRVSLSTGTAAEIVAPDGDSTGTLVLFPDVFGLRPLFVEHARRLSAAHGWTVVVLEMFPGREDAPVEDKFGLVTGLSDADKVADVEAALDEVGADEGMALGFCMGGMWAMKALRSKRIRRAVAFYGMVRMPQQWRGPGLADALDTVAARAEAGDLSLLCVFGGDDPWCPDEDQAAVRAAGATVEIYPEAGHGWAQDPKRDGYRADDAADAWVKAEAFLSAV